MLGVKKLEDFLLYVLVGLAVWQFISALVSRGVNLIRGYSNSIINSREPVLSYVLSDVLYETMVLVLKSPVLLIAIFIFGSFSLEGALVFGYGVLLIVLSAIGFTLSFGFLAAFVGDFRELISTLMRLSFLITPVIWELKRLGEYQHLVYYNPFYSYLSICRSPLLNEMPGMKEVVIATSLTILLLGVGLYFMSTKIIQLKQKAFEV